MLEFVWKNVRRYPFSVLCVVTVWVLSLLPFFPETPLDDVEFIDKWVHFIMYGGTTIVIWWEYYLHHRQQLHVSRRLLLWGVLAPILMGGLLELLQAYATTTRNGDWLDFAANTLGVVIGVVCSLLCWSLLQRAYK
ncbi:MAG: VanZ family protein [Prevotella sp.]|nr:VanZ family protein [Prevotella sp.]